MNEKTYQKTRRAGASVARRNDPGGGGALRRAHDFKPQVFLDVGLPREIVDHLTRTYESDGSPKGTIFVNGKPVKKLTGVYGLSLLRFLAGALGIEYADSMGRGSEARNIQAALKSHLQSSGSADASSSSAQGS